MNKLNKGHFILGFSFGVLFILIFYFYCEWYDSNKDNIGGDLNKNIYDIIEDSKTFYKYNDTLDNIIRNRTELVKYGGDCETWSKNDMFKM